MGNIGTTGDTLLFAGAQGAVQGPCTCLTVGHIHILFIFFTNYDVFLNDGGLGFPRQLLYRLTGRR